MTVRIRLAAPEDAPAVRDIYAPHVAGAATSFELTPPTAETMAGRIEATIRRYPWLVCERDGEVVGYAYAGEHRSREAYRWSVDCSVYVAEDARRRGVARGLYESLFALLRLQGFYNVYAGTTLPNPASVGFHESMGFERVGVYEDVGYKAGAWHDVLWLGRRLVDPPFPVEPSPPIPLPEIRADERFETALSAGAPHIRFG